MNAILSLIALFGVFISVMMCWQESRRRKINFFAALFICILTTPLIGYFIITSFRLRAPRGCAWCGNGRNEAAYCGRCGKNAEGELRRQMA